MRWILFAALFLLVASAAHAVDIIVPGDYQTIQEAINNANHHDRVLVSPGTYDENITMRDSVHVVSSQGAAVTTIDGSGGVRTVVADSVAAVFDGFTVTGGTSPTNGAGMNVTGQGWEMIIQNCIFTGNSADGQGGGLAVQNATAVIDGCEFTMNDAAGGAAVYVFGTFLVPVRFESCVIYNNTSTGPGGGIFVEEGLANVLDTMIYNNSSTGLGGGVAADGGVTDIGNCSIYSNTAGEGGGVSFHNTAAGEVQSSTIHNNVANIGGGLSCTNNSTNVTISKTIITLNEGNPGAMNCGVGSMPTVECSDLWGNIGGDTICGTDAGDNLNLDPQYCHMDPTAEGNFQIQSDSPCTQTNSPCSLLIGARGIGCGTDPVEPATWGQIKSQYR
jgi:hypothetical protein